MTTKMDEAVRMYGKPTMTSEQLAQWERDVRSGALRAVLADVNGAARSFSVEAGRRSSRAVNAPDATAPTKADTIEYIMAMARRKAART